MDMHTEDARRIIMRAANCPRSPQRPIGVSGVSSSGNNQILNVIGSRVSATVSSPPVFQPPQPPPLTSTGSNSSSGSSSGHSSMSGTTIPPVTTPEPASTPPPPPQTNIPHSRLPIHYSTPSQIPLNPNRHSNSASNLLETNYDYSQVFFVFCFCFFEY